MKFEINMKCESKWIEAEGREEGGLHWNLFTHTNACTTHGRILRNEKGIDRSNMKLYLSSTQTTKWCDNWRKSTPPNYMSHIVCYGLLVIRLIFPCFYCTWNVHMHTREDSFKDTQWHTVNRRYRSNAVPKWQNERMKERESEREREQEPR